MRIKKQSSKKKYIIPLAALLVLVGGYLAFASVNKLPPFPTANEPDDSNVNYEPPTDEEKNAGSDASGQGKTTETPSKPPTTGSDTPASETPESKNISMEITAANQNGSKLQVRTLIQSITTGTCTLTVSRAGSQTITRTAKNQTLSNTSTCMGFDVSTAGLAKGEWRITVDFVSGSSKGSTSRSVVLE